MEARNEEWFLGRRRDRIDFIFAGWCAGWRGKWKGERREVVHRGEAMA
jgi:hypothetical protein